MSEVETLKARIETLEQVVREMWGWLKPEAKFEYHKNMVHAPFLSGKVIYADSATDRPQAWRA